MAITYMRAGLILAVLGLTAWGGWTARAWLEDSRELDQAREERDRAIERERAAETRATEAETRATEAEKIRGKIAGDLEKERAKINETTRPIIKRIPVYVDRGACTLSVDGVRDLNAARGAIVPNAERRIAGESITRRADPGL